jgi:DNA-binding NarL/FixJ family response regulator
MKTAPVSVLVIESHPMLREALRHAIISESDLTLAEPVLTGSQPSQMVIAVQSDAILLTYKPDIILFSFEGSGSYDLETLTVLRRSLPDTPILALISGEVEGQGQAVLEAGVQAVLTKAAPRDELIEKLKELGGLKILENGKVAVQKEAPIEISVSA